MLRQAGSLFKLIPPCANNLECGPGDKPAWVIYAESRGGDLTIDINEGQFVFIFLYSVNKVLTFPQNTTYLFRRT